jgi:hypothetical protein
MVAARIDPGDQQYRVRWKVGSRWRYGTLCHLQVIERDGSLRVYDDYTGGARSIPAEVVQHQQPGPRGGRRWVGSELAPVVIGAQQKVQKPAQLGLFNNTQ